MSTRADDVSDVDSNLMNIGITYLTQLCFHSDTCHSPKKTVLSLDCLIYAFRNIPNTVQPSPRIAEY